VYDPTPHTACTTSAIPGMTRKKIKVSLKDVRWRKLMFWIGTLGFQGTITRSEIPDEHGE
jgi:hypothetical protein